MKKLFLFFFTLLFLTTSCESPKIHLTSPNYEEFGFWGMEPPSVFESEDYAVITTLNSFFIYNMNAEKITTAYGIDTEKMFLPGFFIRPLFDSSSSKIILNAERDLNLFREYHLVYDIEKDKFMKEKGIGKLENRQDTYNYVQYDGEIMSSDLETIYFISKFTNMKIYPFKDNFNAEDFNKQ